MIIILGKLITNLIGTERIFLIHMDSEAKYKFYSCLVIKYRVAIIKVAVF